MRDQIKNILVIMSDEHRRDAMGSMGSIVKTPNLDKLASRGAVFENAYTPSPMCVPARAALACGDHVHRISNWDSATPYDGSKQSWMRVLRNRGMDMVSIGKLHFRSTGDDNGFSEEILPMHVVGGVGWPVGLLRERPPEFSSASELAANLGAGESSYKNYDLEITAAAEKWLSGKRNSKKPWGAFVSLVSPHYPLIAPEKFYRIYDPVKIDMPIAYEPSERADHQEIRNLANFFDYDRHFDEIKIRKAKAAYYGLTSFMDDCVGRILTALEASGQSENTLVIYTSDHGEMLGDHGLWTKMVMYEASVGIPMIIAGPGIPAGRRVKTGATLLDIAATVQNVTGAKDEQFSASPTGRSLIDLARQDDDLDRTVFSEYHDGGSTTGTFMVRWDHWKYVFYVGYPPQFFDLANDPDERTNLAGAENNSPSVSNALKQGNHRLMAICDPDEVNKRCFADQKRRIEELGGEEACLNAFAFNHTPTPTEQESLTGSVL